MLYNVPVRRYKNPNHMGVLQKMYSMISYWLKYYRHECGLTQQQVADRLKIERSTYTYYETGKTKPDISRLQTFCVKTIFCDNGDKFLIFNDKNAINID